MTGTGNSGMVGVIQLQKEIFSEGQISKAFPPVVHCRVCLVISMSSSSLTYHFNTIDPSFFLDASSSHIFKAKHSPNFSPITLTTSLQSSLFILPHPPNYQTLNNSVFGLRTYTLFTLAHLLISNTKLRVPKFLYPKQASPLDSRLHTSNCQFEITTSISNRQNRLNKSQIKLQIYPLEPLPLFFLFLYGNFIFFSSCLDQRSCSHFSLTHLSYLIYQEILLVLPTNYIQNLILLVPSITLTLMQVNISSCLDYIDHLLTATLCSPLSLLYPAAKVIVTTLNSNLDITSLLKNLP